MKHLILALSLLISIYSANAFGRCIKGDCDNGQGTYKYSHGTEYDGQWKNSRLNGQGILTYPDGSKYVGQWKNNQRHGKGVYIYADNSKYVGLFEDSRRNGQGTYIHPDGSKYVGLFKDGERNGKGTYTFSDGSEYVGQWKNNQRHGIGTYTFPDGRKYVGQWKNNSYVEAPKSAQPYIPVSKKIAEKKSRKAESLMSSKVSKKLLKKRYHTVNSGESLWGISRRYGLTLKNIQILNKLSSRSLIYPGQKLLVTL
jgi:hypothetical protein